MPFSSSSEARASILVALAGASPLARSLKAGLGLSGELWPMFCAGYAGKAF